MKIKVVSRSWLNLTIVIVSTFLAACGGGKSEPTFVAPTTTLLPSASPIPDTLTMPPTSSLSQNPIETVSFATTDGVTLAGTLFGKGGDTAVILAHQGTPGADQSTWQPFANLLAEHGYTALTFDFRGVGKSGGKLLYGNLAMDVSAAAQFLQDRGYQKIVCAGASMGGTACIRAAQDYSFVGLVALASTMTAGSGATSLYLASADFESLTQPKLFISAENDFGPVVSGIKRMYELSPNPKNLLFLPGTQHGTSLFNTDAGEELSAVILRFIENIDNQVSETLPPLQTITVENANKVQPLRTMEIPDYQRGQLSQCSLAFSPDGRLLVGACGKNRVPVWDVQSGFLLRTLYEAPVQVVACAFSSGGKQIACGGFDKTITLWDASIGKKIDDLEGHTAPIWDLAFDPTGKSLASCSLGLLGDGTGRGDIRLWNMPDGQPSWSYIGAKDYLSISFDPLGKTIAYGSIGGSVGILDAVTGKLLRELTDSTHNIGDVAYSPSGHWLAAGSDDDRVYLWDTSNYKLTTQLTGHSGYVNGVAFDSEDTLLVSGSHDKTVGIWNLAERKLITQLSGHEREVLRVAFSPDGTLIASISWDGTVRLWGVSK